jgi:hypothetical protein
MPKPSSQLHCLIHLTLIAEANLVAQLSTLVLLSPA